MGMKRFIFTLILLTVVVVSPPVYFRWAESQRLSQIEKIKEQARPIFGERLETVLSNLKRSEPPSVVILHTGGTQSHLEPCGCYQEQSGGLPRRAYIVEQVRQQGFPTLLVDAGNIFDGTAEIDTKRCRVNLKAMSAMRYDMVALSKADLSYGDMYLNEQHGAARFPFLSSTENSFTQPFVIKKLGKHSIAFVVEVVHEQVLSDVSVVVALGDSEVSKHINVAIRP